MNNFQELKLPESLHQALRALQFTQPTPIQAQAIPPALQGQDLIGIAQTGTGKTAAFSIPLLMRFLGSKDGCGLVLAPTRELAQQIEEFWHKLTKFTPAMRGVLIVGGAAFNPQVRALKARPRLIIATPGRLVDHLEQRTVDLSSCRALVLDEADRMLDMGFAPQLGRIRSALPTERQTLLFSATWGPEMDDLSRKYLKSPARVSVGVASQAAKTVAQSAILTVQQRKNETLLDEINARKDGSILVFARTQHRTDRVARYLSSYGLDVNRLHGGRTQGQRTNALSAFRDGRVRVLVATDIAARGIDVSSIGHVINYDLPRVAEDYIHRIGRTGRAGAEGSAVSFVTPEDRAEWQAILKVLGKTGSPMPITKDLRAAATTAPAARPQRPQQTPSQPARQAQPQATRRPLQPHERGRAQTQAQPQQGQRHAHSQRPSQGQGRRVDGGGLRVRAKGDDHRGTKRR